MPKRKWQSYRRGEHDYKNELRHALTNVAQAAKRAACKASGRGDDLRVHDTSHLLVTESFELKDGEPLEIKFFHPLRLVQYVLDNSELLAQHYGEMALKHGQETWNLIIGCDEQTPGSKVNHDNKRKNMCVAMSFIEVGFDLLENDDCWFVPATFRSNLCKKVLGGWSAILRRLLRRALLGPESFPIQGLLVRFKSPHGAQRCVQIKARLHTILTDGEGHQVSLEWNGPSSMRPTFDFANVFLRGSGMERVHGYVDITCSELSAMRRWTYEHWLRNIDGVLDARERHSRGELSSANLKQYIKSAGFCATKYGLLADTDLREAVNLLQVFKYDFMHTSFQDGYMSNAMYLICESVLRIKHGNANDGQPLVDFLKSLQFSSYRSSDRCRLHAVFCEKLMTKHRKRKCIVANASCQLSLYKLLEFWADEAAVGCPSLPEHCAVYNAACRVTDVFRDTKHRRLDTQAAAEQLPTLINRWQELHKAKYGVAYFKPKFCWIWSIALDLASSDFHFDMWYVERQHRRVKVHAESVRNVTTFESSVLMRVLDSQLSALQVSILLNGLPARKVRTQCCGIDAFVGDRLVCKGASLHCDDLVLRGLRLGCVVACYEREDGLLLALVELMRATACHTQFEHTAHRELWPAEDLRGATAWKPTRFPKIFDVIV